MSGSTEAVSGAVGSGCTATVSGGGYYNGLSIGGNMAVRNTSFFGNSAPLGGALLIQQTTDSNSSMELTNLLIDGNTADQGAGAVLDGIDVTMTDGSMTTNVAAVSGGGFTLLNGATVSAVNLDVGSGALGNSPEDVELSGQTYQYDGMVGFDCDSVCQ